MPLPTPPATVTVSIADILGGATQGSVEFQLCGFQQFVPRIIGTEVLVDVAPDPVDPDVDGLVTTTLWPNNLISPAGTYYLVTFNDDNGDPVQVAAYRFTGGGPFDLSTYPQIDPDNPPPPPMTGLRWVEVVADVAGNAQFDAAVGSQISTTFHIVLTQDTIATFVNLIEGIPYFVLVEQDDTGHWAFTWPDNAGNAMQVSSEPSSSSLQGFVGVSVTGQLDAGSMMSTGSGSVLPQ